MKKKSSVIVGEKVSGAREKNTERRPSPTHDEIARVAFFLYESRGRQDGQAIEDWLRAEQELVRHSA